MSAMTHGTAVVTHPGVFTTDGLLIGIPQSRNIYHPEPYTAPDGTIWVSRGAYEQGLKLQAAYRRIAQLETELADLRFPISGMSGEYAQDNSNLRVWPSHEDEHPSALFVRDEKCSFCVNDWIALFIEHPDDNGDRLAICQSCLNKVFDAFDKKVTG